MASKKEWKATAKNYERLYREALRWRNLWYDKYEDIGVILKQARFDLEEALAEIEAWRSGAAGDYHEEAQWGSANDPR
jgi:hypothetical protein